MKKNLHFVLISHEPQLRAAETFVISRYQFEGIH